MLVSLDIESTGVNAWKEDRPFALSLTWDNEETEYYHWYVNPFTRKVQQPNAVQRRRLGSIFADPNVPKVGHNILFDVLMMELSWGLKFDGTIHDTMFMAHACNSLEPTLKLKVLANKYLKIPNDDEIQLQALVVAGRREGRKLGWNLGEEVEQDYWIPSALARTPEEMAACEEYCVLDTKRSLYLYRMYLAVMEKDKCAAKTYERERLLWWTTKRMTERGIRTDLTVVRREIEHCNRREHILRKQLTNAFGEFKKQIPDQRVRHLLYGPKTEGGMGFTPDPNKLTEKTKLPQITRDVLETYQNDVPVILGMIEYDKIVKANGTYFQNYLNGAVKDEKGEWILHAGFNQVGPKTGRYSCRNPNLTNVPKRAPEGDIMQRVRGPFGPRSGCIWLHLDYQGIEARIFAELANETDMIRIFSAGGDVYQELVDRIVAMTRLNLVKLLGFADSAGKPGSGARQICKNNFLGWLFGEGAEKLMRAMRLPNMEIASQVIMALRAAYPKAQPFMWSMQERAKALKHVVNRYGRRIPIERPIRDKETGKWTYFWYKSVNYAIQSTAADMMKTAMRACEDYLIRLGFGYMVMMIHDELVFEFPIHLLQEHHIRRLGSIMQTAAEEHFTKVRFPTDASITLKQWSTPEKLDKLKDELFGKRKVVLSVA